MGLKYGTKDLTTAAPAGLPEFSCPLPGRSEKLLFTQKWSKAVPTTGAWTPANLNTKHPDFSTFVLVAEGPLSDLTAGMVSWTRTYAAIPPSYTEPGGNYAYNFIGFYGVFGLNTTTVTGRDRFTRPVQVHVFKDWFIVGDVYTSAGALANAGSSGNTGTSVTSPLDVWESIPEIPMQEYYSVTPSVKVDFIADSPPLVTATTPDRTTYQAAVTAGDLIVIEPSKISRWNGNIFYRETLKVVAL